MNAPKLRFKGVYDEWQPRIFEELYEFKNGLNKEKEAFGSGIPIVNYMDVNKNTYIDIHDIKGKVNLTDSEIERFLVKNNDLFFTRTSETSEEIGMTCSYTGENTNLVFSGFVLKASPKIPEIDSTFYAYYLRTFNKRKLIIKHSSITTRALTSGTLLSSMSINYTSTEEQKKIAEFLKKLDYKIQLQQEKVDLLKEQKKGYMQKTFSQELKFKDKNGQEYPEWIQQKLGNFSERVTRKNSDLTTTRPLTISAKHGLIDQVEFFNKTVASENLTGYYLLNKGEFAYNKSYSNGYPLGAIKRLDNYENGALSTLYICFTPKDNVNSNFLVHYFDSTQWYKEVSLICVEGARNHGLLNVSITDFFDTLHYLPCLEEQVKIAKFFDCINQKIKLNEQKLKNLQDQKQAFMQQMFI